MCDLKEVQEYIRRTDMQVYQKVVEILIPDLWIPIPGNSIPFCT